MHTTSLAFDNDAPWYIEQEQLRKRVDHGMEERVRIVEILLQEIPTQNSVDRDRPLLEVVELVRTFVDGRTVLVDFEDSKFDLLFVETAHDRDVRTNRFRSEGLFELDFVE